jgi:hypothetical protein
MTITEFIEQLKVIQDDSGCDGKTISSHDIKSEVRFHTTDGEEYELVEMETEVLNCLCIYGVDIILKKVEE